MSRFTLALLAVLALVVSACGNDGTTAQSSAELPEGEPTAETQSSDDETTNATESSDDETTNATESSDDETTNATESSDDETTNATESSDDETSETAESSDDADSTSDGDLLAALLFAGEAEAASADTAAVYGAYLTQVFPCIAEDYVGLFGDLVEPPYDAASVRANAESGSSLSLSLRDPSSFGPEAHLASLDGTVECVGGVYEANQWDLAFQYSDGRLSGTASDWLGYAGCILDTTSPSESELIADHYYWYYDSGASEGPLDNPGDYFELSSDFQARTSDAHGDSLSFDDPCVHPG